jgi:hypothetical protein
LRLAVVLVGVGLAIMAALGFHTAESGIGAIFVASACLLILLRGDGPGINEKGMWPDLLRQRSYIGAIVSLVGIALVASVLLLGWSRGWGIDTREALALGIGLVALGIGEAWVYRERDGGGSTAGGKRGHALARISQRPSIQALMEQAWADHHHTRRQSWEALKLELVVAAGIVGIRFARAEASTNLTSIAALLLCLLALTGAMITFHHRVVEREQLRRIANCEAALGLTALLGPTRDPEPLYIWDMICPWKANTSIFFLRMHVGILVFALTVLIVGL